ncbi:MAG TPA: hypothetical protein VMS17_22905, partial [Gemmataceae bacterium]|nr:hypothetical protein [Gemmataceae bacterium]
MSWSLRRVLVVLTAVAACGTLACLQTAFAQRGRGGIVAGPIVVNPGAGAAGLAGSAEAASFDLPRDTDARARIVAAHEYIEAKRWPEVVKALQLVLDDDHDKFAPLTRKGPDGKEVEVPTSVRAEANRLLAGLPSDGLEVYKTTVGPTAAGLLATAKGEDVAKTRKEELGLIISRYLHTDAGAEAADLLATQVMDEGDFRTAARYYSLLLTRAGGADSLQPDVLFRAAYAFRQTGDKAHEDQVWQSTRSRGIHEIKFGEETHSVSELQDYLASVAPAIDVVGRQWPYFMGDASRTDRGDGGAAFMWRRWSENTTIYQTPTGSTNAPEDVGRREAALFKAAADKLSAVKQPVLPPQFPVAAFVTHATDGKKTAEVVYRTHSGVAVRDLGSGKLEGLSPVEGSLEWMMDGARQSALQQWEPL